MKQTNLKYSCLIAVLYFGMNVNGQTTPQDTVPKEQKIEEVVMIGYGKQKRGDLTSSISSVKSEDITKQPATTAMQSLQGKLSGVTIVNTDQPGATPSVIVRGLGTALGGRDPLYVVDGMIVPNITNINPRDIESIDVLKDAASTAIYGVRAANGVVIVTTKTGKKGRTKISFDSYFGVKSILNKVKMADASQYAQYFNEERKANGKTTFLSPNQQYNTNWLDELTRTGIVQDNNVTISGGGENVNYFLGADHFTENGILEGQDYRRTTIRNNNTYKLFNNRVRITQNVSFSNTKENIKPLGAFDTAHRQAPVIPVKYENGKWGMPYWNESTGLATYPGITLNSHGNPLSSVYYTNEVARTNTLQAFLQADIDVTKDLTFTSRAGTTKYWYSKETFVPTRATWLAADPTRTDAQFQALQDANPTNASYVNNSFGIEKIDTFRWQWENYFTYNKKIGRHSITAVIGTSSEEVGVGGRMYGRAYNLSDKSQYWSLDLAGSGPNKTIEQVYYTPVRYLSYFGRLQYDFDKKYYVSGIIRRDGTSRFRQDEKYWDTFPSVSAGWNISNEDFLKDNSFINFLKVRGGWGTLGNDNIGVVNVSNTGSGPGSQDYNYVFGPGQDLIFGAYFGSPAYPLGWEITKEWSVGTDFELLNKRLTGSFDYYQKKNTNTILKIKPILSGPYKDDFYDHGAVVMNKGWEVALRWKDFSESGNFSYEIGATFNSNDNKVQEVKPAYGGMTGGSLGNGSITKRLEVGQSLGSWWMYEVEGVWQNTTEINNNAHLSGAKPGFLRYKDQNGDGVIDDRDKVFFGSYIPTYNYSVHLGFTYKNIDFSIDGYGAGGNKIYNGLNSTRIGGENVSQYMFNNRWTGEGSTNTNPGANRDVEASNYYLEDGDYFRINNITLGYNFKDAIQGLRNLRVYLTAQNPFIFTKYEGYTPELNSNGDPYGTTGVELSAYPNLRSFILGVNVEF
ncbi:SusC/RagA family TonB-linked outer membrane protein [Chryseobacterium zhengzhouense]|uniref:SusC/RagA family TonB-linked outer membrane protein n=1 Tax=Chryseobacterium zhengzhouense TaxID=1636086 RepID=A0ABW2M127_9FLAO